MPERALVCFRSASLLLPMGWSLVPRLPGRDRGVTALPAPESDGSFRAVLVLTFIPMTALDLRTELLHLIEQIRQSRPGMTEPIASELRLGELPSEALRIRWSGPKGPMQDEFVAIELDDEGERGLLFADAMFEVGDHETRGALQDALRTFTLRASGKAP